MRKEHAEAAAADLRVDGGGRGGREPVRGALSGFQVRSEWAK